MRLKENIRQLSEVFKLLLPQKKQEICILLFFMVFYLSYAFFIALNTSIIDSIDQPFDLYFSFDNPIIYDRGYTYVPGHPLMKYMTMPFIFLGDLLANLYGYKAKTIFLTIICTLLISLSVVYIFRYLRTIIELNANVSYILSAFYGFSSTCLILSFTTESFTITAFFLSFTMYFYSYAIKNRKEVRLASNAFFAVALGGITITNFVKGVIPILFISKSLKIIIRKVILVGLIFAILLVFVAIESDFYTIIKYQILNNTGLVVKGSYFEKVFEALFASPWFFPNLMVLDFTMEGVLYKAISLDFYHSWWQYIFPLSISVLIIFSLIKNYKNKLVQLITLCILVDVVLHGVIQFGIRDAFIYAGHWIFFVPLIIGWGYKSITNLKVRKIANIILGLLLLLMLSNNIIRMIEFIKLSLETFPPYTR